MNEKIVEINGISVSNIGFKDLQFETSRTSNGVKAIRGFGSSLNEENLNIIDTVAVSFVVNAIELKNIAKIYQMFKVCGVLPIYNEYLLKKLKSTYLKGKTDEEIKNAKTGIYKDLWIKEDTEYFLCLLQKIEIHSLEKTADGYNVNMILTLFDKSLNKEEYKEYINKFSNWKIESKFENIVDGFQKENKIDEFNYGNIDLKIYNVERLNQIYKENILNTFKSNSKIIQDRSEIMNEKKQEEYYSNISDKQKEVFDKKEQELLNKKKLTEQEEKELEFLQNSSFQDKLKNSYTKLSIANKHILQIELMTNNLISNVPIIGSPIGYKSYLGVGDSFFNVKLIFKEEENNIVEELKRISDKNIIDHKIEIEHPLVQLFDFYSANIVNIVFNNIEQANGIMVSIVFSLNGFKYSDESTINSESFISSIDTTYDYKQEKVGGLYLEILADYLFKNDIKDNDSFYNLLQTPMEIRYFNQRGKDNLESQKDKIFKANYNLSDFFSSYISYPTCIGYFNKLVENGKINSISFSVTDEVYSKNYKKGEDLLNNQFNLSIKDYSSIYDKDIFFINNVNTDIGDFSQILKNNPFYNSNNFIQFIDNVSAITICSNDKYKNEVSKIFSYNNTRTASIGTNTGLEILNDIIRKLSVELFNSKQNFETNELEQELSKRMYEIFFIKIFDTLNKDKTMKNYIADSIIKKSFIKIDDKKIFFKDIYNAISDLSNNFFEMFLRSFYDENYIERLVDQITEDYEDYSKRITERKEENKKLSKENAIKFITELRIELEILYSKNKTVIVERSYNLFLTKIIHILYSFQLKKNVYGVEHSKEQLENYIKLSLLSSSILSILFLKSSKRTDRFDNPIILGTQNIGYKISLYNKYVKQDDNKFKMFYDFFDNFTPKENINRFHYSDLSKEDIEFEISSKFNKNIIPKKDINYIYSKQLEKTDENIKISLFKILNKEKNTELKNCNEWIKIQRDNFLNNIISESFNDKDIENELHKTSVNVRNIKFPSIFYGYLPSFFFPLFYDESFNKDIFTFTALEKERIIANSDPFNELEQLYDIVLDPIDYTIPDYSIIVSHKITNTEYSGDFAEIETGEVNIVLTNVVSVNIVKNPKDKIKTANIVINNISKSIFNFNQESNSFDIKIKKDGKIDIIKIVSGDEIRIALGHGDNNQVFNGFINKVMVNNSSIIISASSFASALYAKKIEELKIKSDKILEGNFFKKIFNQMKSSIDSVDEMIKKETISNSFNKGINGFLFNFIKDVNFNKIFNRDEKASMYSVTILSLGTLPNKVTSKFTKTKNNNITSTKLATDLYLKKSLQSPLGSFQFDATGSFSSLIYENLNNVDSDYETYGMNIYGRKEIGSSYGTKDFNNYHNVDYVIEELDQGIDKNGIVKKPSNIENKEMTSTFKESTKDGIYKLDCYPVNLNKGHKITSLYNEDRAFNKKHKGIDIALDSTKDKQNYIIYNVRDGIVNEIGYTPSTGNYVKIRHNTKIKDIKNINGIEKIIEKDSYFISCYYHLDEIRTSKGKDVKAKEIIGIMGTTGRSSGTHLHFELRTEKNETINPFGTEVLPEPNGFELFDIISWSEVGKKADIGRYTSYPKWKNRYKG